MEHYADPMDRATVESEMLLAEQLRVARSTEPPALPATGQCYNCDEGLEPGIRFCDEHCRDDYEQRQRSRAQLPIQRR